MANAAGAAISMRYGLQGPCETIVHRLRGLHPRHRLRRPADRLGPLRRRGHRRHRGAASRRRRSPASRNMTALSSSGVSMPFDDRARRLRAWPRAPPCSCSRSGSAAVARGATILGEVLGAASNADAHHITAPVARRRRARSRACELALADAGLRAGDIAPDQRPRHVDAAQRRRRGRGRRQGVRRRPARRSPRPRASPATRSAPPAR